MYSLFMSPPPSGFLEFGESLPRGIAVHVIAFLFYHFTYSCEKGYFFIVSSSTLSSFEFH